jgi:hypothetical protein
MNLPDAPIAYEGFFASHFFTAPFVADVQTSYPGFRHRKDSKRFSKSGGWGYAVFNYEAASDIHSILDVMYARAPYTVIQRAMHIHSTVSELIPTMLGELQPLSDGAGAPQ